MEFSSSGVEQNLKNIPRSFKNCNNVSREKIDFLLRTVGKDKIYYSALLELTTKGYIWLDYFSVPQTSSDCAVESIPAYVEMSKFFIILSPPVRHVQSNKILDSSTWRRRGWCAAEAMSRLLAWNTGPMMMTPVFDR